MSSRGFTEEVALNRTWRVRRTQVGLRKGLPPQFAFPGPMIIREPSCSQGLFGKAIDISFPRVRVPW